MQKPRAENPKGNTLTRDGSIPEPEGEIMQIKIEKVEEFRIIIEFKAA
ncbi:hypothetical protein ACWFMI_17080 [Nocardiopsis terrae]